MLEIYCETGVVTRAMVATNRTSFGETWIFAGDLRATFTLPYSVEIVELYRETSTEHLTSFQPGEMHIQMMFGHANRANLHNQVLRFSIFLPESLQGHALAAFIQSGITGVANTVEEHALEFLREN